MVQPCCPLLPSMEKKPSEMQACSGCRRGEPLCKEETVLYPLWIFQGIFSERFHTCSRRYWWACWHPRKKGFCPQYDAQTQFQHRHSILPGCTDKQPYMLHAVGTQVVLQLPSLLLSPTPHFSCLLSEMQHRSEVKLTRSTESFQLVRTQEAGDSAISLQPETEMSL